MSIFENLTMILTRQLNSTAKFSSFSVAMTMINIINFILNECHIVAASENVKSENFHLKKAKKFIEKNFLRQMSITELSSIAALAPSYFIRKFKKYSWRNAGIISFGIIHQLVIWLKVCLGKYKLFYPSGAQIKVNYLLLVSVNQ